jgi:hypothetical protein
MSQSIHIEDLQPSIPGPFAELCGIWLIRIRIVVDVAVNASCCLSLQRLNKSRKLGYLVTSSPKLTTGLPNGNRIYALMKYLEWFMVAADSRFTISGNSCSSEIAKERKHQVKLFIAHA